MTQETQQFEMLFDSDVMTKRQRVEATLRHQPVDRVAILEQLSFNPQVISMVTGKAIDGFDYTLDDIGKTVRRTTDIAMPPCPPRGTGHVVTDEGIEIQNDNWTAWIVSRPFDDEEGARDWLIDRTRRVLASEFDAVTVRGNYREKFNTWQRAYGETVILPISTTGLCGTYNAIGLELFAFFYNDYPEVMIEFLDAFIGREIIRVHAVADHDLTPVVLIAEDFATKQGPTFGPAFLKRCLYPYVKRLTAAWHEHDVAVLFHSDGNWKKAIGDLTACGVDGFYCLEPACGMDIVELKNACPQMVWAGGVDGVDLMERGTPEQIADQVRRQISETKALETGGMFVASSSEINPPIKPENFKAMIDTVGQMSNPDVGSPAAIREG